MFWISVIGDLIMTEPVSTIAALGTILTGISACVASIGGAAALLTLRKNIQWKKAELASSYLKEFYGNQEMVFACRAIDWRVGKLVVPEPLRPLLPDEAKVIEHDFRLLEKALDPRLSITDMRKEDRVQLYRTAMDSLLSWFNVLDNAITRKLFDPAEMPEIRYWLARVRDVPWIEPFAEAFGYSKSLQRLYSMFDLPKRGG
jgi:hypothetical protein